MRRLALVLALTALLVAPAARADADPASDVLYPYSVFFPFDVSFGKREQSELTKTVDAAQKAGYKIKVAIITKPQDLGGVPMMFQKPREYASFLGRELAPFLYTGRLLVVMPNGFGVWWYKHEVAQEESVVGKLTVGPDPSPTQMVVAATNAVRRLSAAAGHPLPIESSGSGGSGAIIGIAAGGAAAVVIAAAGAFLWLRRRKAASPPA